MGVSRRLFEAFQSRNSRAYDMCGRASHAPRAKTSQRCCIFMNVSTMPPSWIWAHQVSFLLPANAELGDTPKGSAPASHACTMEGKDQAPAPSHLRLCRDEESLAYKKPGDMG